ncbi:hypothetical protein JCM10212_003898 [Sporobolomyces blumeae]
MPRLSKPTLLFVSLNVVRFLSIVAISLAFSGEIVTMVHDLKVLHSNEDGAGSPSASLASTTRATSVETASTNIFRRRHDEPPSNFRHGLGVAVDPDEVPSSIDVVPFSVASPSRIQHGSTSTMTTMTVTRPLRMVSMRKREPVSIRDEFDSRVTSTPTTTRARSDRSTQVSTTTTTTTTTKTSTVTRSSPTSSSYLASTTLPLQPGGVVFSPLVRIFILLILSSLTLSEVDFPESSKVGRVVERWWTYAFPPFGKTFGTGVEGVVQLFVGATILSHAVGKFTQVSGWFLFLVGLLNFLSGLAFGSRGKTIRSPFDDSTSPSALRRLRLASSSSDESHRCDQDGEEGQGGRRGGRRGGMGEIEEEKEEARLEIEDRSRVERSKSSRGGRLDEGDEHEHSMSQGGKEGGRSGSSRIGQDDVEDLSFVVVRDRCGGDDSSVCARAGPGAVAGAGGAGGGSSSTTVRFGFGGRQAGSKSRNGPNGIVISGPTRVTAPPKYDVRG